MRNYFGKRGSGTQSLWKFKAGKRVLSVRLYRVPEGSTLTMTIRRCNSGDSYASTATASSGRAGAPRR